MDHGAGEVDDINWTYPMSEEMQIHNLPYEHGVQASYENHCAEGAK